MAIKYELEIVPLIGRGLPSDPRLSPRRHRLLVLASPLLVLAVGAVAAHVFSNLLGRWAWTGGMLVYWALLVGLVWAFAGKERLISWFAPSRGNRLWLALALAAGLLSFPFLLLPNLGLLASIPLVVLWLIFAPVNGACEELYWRGLLLDKTAGTSRWIIVGYSSIAFVANHPLMLGVFAKAMAVNLAAPGRLIPFGAIVFFQGLVWSILFLRTGSLRLSILSHALTDLGTLFHFHLYEHGSGPVSQGLVGRALECCDAFALPDRRLRLLPDVGAPGELFHPDISNPIDAEM